MTYHYVTRGAAYWATRDLLCEAAVHGDVLPEHGESVDRMLRASPFRSHRYLRKIVDRAMRLSKLKDQVERLPDSLDVRGERLVDAHSLTAAWLADQFEIFDEQMRGIALH